MKSKIHTTKYLVNKSLQNKELENICLTDCNKNISYVT
jgi:hypothetical protein